MTTYTNFERSLCQEAKLFSLPKGHTDLLLLLQTTTLTYSQLNTTGIHGTSSAAARLALKRLEGQKYIQSNTIPNKQTKYYTLTPHGKHQLEKIYPQAFFSRIHANFDRRVPTSQYQLLHRIHTNDLYCAFISSEIKSLPIWQLEQPLPVKTLPAGTTITRCDGLLQTAYGNYYIEQDNATQSEAVLSNKLSQYLTSALFNRGEFAANALIFSFAFPRQRSHIKKPPYSIYRLLLKMGNLWSALEAEYNITFDYLQFEQVFASSPLYAASSKRDLTAFLRLKELHPGIDSLADINSLKRQYLNDTSYNEELLMERDALFQKRLSSKLLPAIKKLITLYPKLVSGLQLYAVPNHRLHQTLPFIMPQEYHLIDHLNKCLYYSGLNIDHWRYKHAYELILPDRVFHFRQAYTHIEHIAAIAIETVPEDLGASARIKYFLRYHSDRVPVLYLILVDSEEHMKTVHKDFYPLYKNPAIKLCYMVKSDVLYATAPRLYAIKADTPVIVTTEYDEFDQKFIILEREGTL